MSTTFGIEIETVGITTSKAARALLSAGIDANDEGYNHITRAHWKAVRDGSLSTELGSGSTAEVVSPVLNVTDFEQLKTVVGALSRAGARVNKSCGIHVHVGGHDLAPAAIHRAAVLWRELQDATDLLVSPARREGVRQCRCGAMHCHFAQRLNDQDLALIADGAWERICDSQLRYRTFNAGSMHRIPTVEFRQHQGSLNATKIWAWADYCQAMLRIGQSGRTYAGPMGVDALKHTENVVSWVAGLGYMQSKNAEYLIRHSAELASR